MKRLLIVTAALEAGAGIALMGQPSAMATLLLGAPLPTAAVVSVARVGAAGLFALGVASWMARRDAWSIAARGLIAGLLAYNVGATAVLAAAGLQLHPTGIALWPAVIVHAAMAAWCLAGLRIPTTEKTP
jgi:hypothetical protein